ncbi:MAG TPA: ACT domain-containing protein, partial [Acidimicrobiales bacterium]
QPELTGPDARGLADLRRLEAVALVADAPALIERVGRAPLSYVLRQPSDVIARHSRLVHPTPDRTEVRVRTGPAGAGRWWIDVAARDRPALLATVTGALARSGLDVGDAVVATWDDGAAIETFTIRSATPPDASILGAAVREGLGEAPVSEALPDAEVGFDHEASPWHSVCEVRAPDRPGLLHDVAAAFDAAGVDVLAADLHSEGGLVIDRFDVVDRNGAKLGAGHEDAVRRFLRAGVAPRRRFGRRQAARRSASQASARG